MRQSLDAPCRGGQNLLDAPPPLVPPPRMVPHGCQKPCPPPARRPQPPSPPGHRPGVPAPSLLRSPGFGTRQVRDAPPGPRRTDVGHASDRRLRPVPRRLLLRPGRLRGSRLARPAPAPPRAASETQNVAYGGGVPPPATRPPSPRGRCRPRGPGPGPLRHRRPPAYRRAGPDRRRKKGAPTDAPGVEGPPPDRSADWQGRYEDLRRLAVAEPPALRCPGLGVFLRQGLAAWVYAWPAHDTPEPEPARRTAVDRAATALPPHLRGPLIGLLADMILQQRPEVLPCATRNPGK